MNKKKLIELLVGFVAGALICAMITLLSSCTTTKVVEVPVVHKEYINKTDSFIKTDSVYEKEFVKVKGDTVYWERRIIEHHNVHVPTYVETVKVDSIPYPVEVIKEVPRKLAWYERFLVGSGIFLYIIIFLIFGAYIVCKSARQSFLH